MRTRCGISLAAVMALCLVGCGGGDKPAPGASTATMPPPEVGVVKVALADVGWVTELPGRTEASRVAQIRARTPGIVQRQLFKEGSEVKAGQILFQLDSAPYRAALASAQAALTKAEANQVQAKALADRYRPLSEAQAVSQQEYVSAIAAARQAEADVASGRAAVQSAQINLDYATVISPIAGRIGRAWVTEGALVGQGEATQLAVVQQIDPLFVNFTQSASEVLRLRSALSAGQLKRASGSSAAVIRVQLDDGSIYPLAGKLLFSDLSVDPATGQIALRAEIPNPKGALLPGLFVRVRMEQAQAPSAFLLPQQAVTTGPQGSSVLVVGADSMVKPRAVKLGPAKDGQWIVLEGLTAGEQVIVDGFQKMRPNTPVKAVPWQAPVPASVTSSSGAARPLAASAAGNSASR